MYAIVWEFQVRPEQLRDFITAYSANGAWAQLFGRAEGYLGTELLSASREPGRYLTIDRWMTPADFERFQRDFQERYETLDAACASMTTAERKIGSFSSAE